MEMPSLRWSSRAQQEGEELGKDLFLFSSIAALCFSSKSAFLSCALLEGCFFFLHCGQHINESTVTYKYCIK